MVVRRRSAGVSKNGVPETEAEVGRRPSEGPAFPGWIPRKLKRQAGAGVGLIPAHLRTWGGKLSKETRSEIRRTLRRRLGKYAGSIERVSVRVSDVNGPRGGMDRRCRVKVVLSNLPSVVAEGQSASVEVAAGEALSAAERAVRRALQRRRTKPIKDVKRRRPRAGRRP